MECQTIYYTTFEYILGGIPMNYNATIPGTNLSTFGCPNLSNNHAKISAT